MHRIDANLLGAGSADAAVKISWWGSAATGNSSDNILICEDPSSRQY